MDTTSDATSDDTMNTTPDNPEATQDQLRSLWQALLDHLLRVIQGGTANAATIEVARGFLRDNAVTLSGLSVEAELEALKDSAVNLPFGGDLRLTGEDF